MEVVTYCCVLYMMTPGCVSAHHQQTYLLGFFRLLTAIMQIMFSLLILILKVLHSNAEGRKQTNAQTNTRLLSFCEPL